MEQLRVERARRQLTIDELYRRSGVAPVTISQLERGIRKARPSTLAKLAAGLGVDVSVLMDGEPEPYKASREKPIKAEMPGGGTLEFGSVAHYRRVAQQLRAEVAAVRRGEAADLTYGMWFEVDRFIGAQPHIPDRAGAKALLSEYTRLLEELQEIERMKAERVEDARQRLAESGHSVPAA